MTSKADGLSVIFVGCGIVIALLFAVLFLTPHTPTAIVRGASAGGRRRYEVSVLPIRLRARTSQVRARIGGEMRIKMESNS